MALTHRPGESPGIYFVYWPDIPLAFATIVCNPLKVSDSVGNLWRISFDCASKSTGNILLVLILDES